MRGDRDRDEKSGRYVESLSEDDVLDVFRSRDDPHEPLTAREIGDVLGFDRRTVDNRLRQMAERDRVATKKIGARARAWWLPGESVSTGDGST
jgi:DNA-binding MarR family transcriptional regulator